MPKDRCECGGELLPSVMAGLIVRKCDECGRAYQYREVVQPPPAREQQAS